MDVGRLAPRIVRSAGYHPSMHADLAAGTEPTVVFIAQLGTAGPSWRPVLDRLTSGSATLTYDRPGIGNTPPRPAPNPPAPYSVHADELEALLEAHGIPGPVVLVGHSVGSLIVRAFASMYPARVAGMVHVDGSIPRLTLWPGADTPVDGDGPHATAFDTITGEIEILTATYPEVPSIVVTRTPGRWDVPLPHPAIDDLWSVSQQLLARELNAPLVVAADAGHQTPREAPALVAHLVDQVVTAVRDGAKRCTLDQAAVEQVGAGEVTGRVGEGSTRTASRSPRSGDDVRQ